MDSRPSGRSPAGAARESELFATHNFAMVARLLNLSTSAGTLTSAIFWPIDPNTRGIRPQDPTRAPSTAATASTTPPSPGGSRTRSISITSTPGARATSRSTRRATSSCARTPQPGQRDIDLFEVVEGLKARDLTTPVVVRFSDILAHRLSTCTPPSRRPSPRTTTRTAMRPCSRSR